MDKNIFKINIDSTIREALELINLNKNGAIFVEQKNRIIGIITDGDIRRSLLKDITIDEKINNIINSNFVYLSEEQASRENILKLLDNEIKLIPIAVLKALLKSICLDKTIVSRTMLVIIPFIIASSIIDKVGQGIPES